MKNDKIKDASLKSQELENEVLNEEQGQDTSASSSSKFKGQCFNKQDGIYRVNVVYASLPKDINPATGIVDTAEFEFVYDEELGRNKLAPGQIITIKAVTEHGQTVRIRADHASYGSVKPQDTSELAPEGIWTLENVQYRPAGYKYRDKDGNVVLNDEGQPYEVKHPHFATTYGKLMSLATYEV